MTPPDPEREATIVDLHRSHYVELVHLAAVFVDDITLCEEVVQDAYVKLPTLQIVGADGVSALRQMVLTLARSSTAEAGAVTTGELATLRRLDRDDADVIALHHYLDMSVEESAAALGLALRPARKALKRGEKQLDRLTADSIGGAT